MAKKNTHDKVNSLLDDLKPFLKNLEKGIATFGVNGVNNHLHSMLTKGSEKETTINLIVDAVCRDFLITKRALLRSYSRATKEAKYTCACLLHFELNLPIRHISQKVFKQKGELGFVPLAIKRHKNIGIVVKPDIEYKERYDRILNSISDKLNK